MLLNEQRTIYGSYILHVVLGKKKSALLGVPRNEFGKHCDTAMLQETHLFQMDVHRIENIVYKLSAFSSAPNKAKGVMIMIDKKLKFTILVKSEDQECRIKHNGKKTTFINVYAPNSYDPTFFDSPNSI